MVNTFHRRVLLVTTYFGEDISKLKEHRDSKHGDLFGCPTSCTSVIRPCPQTY